MLDARAEVARPARVAPRAGRDTDLPFVLNSWSATWRLSQTCKRLRTAYPAYFDEIVVRGVLARPEVSLAVMALERDPDEIAAWLCFSPADADGVPVVHYAYVRPEALSPPHEPLRRCGLLLALLAVAGVVDALLYTFRPQDRGHPRSNKSRGAERALVDGLRARGIVAQYRPVEQYLRRTRTEGAAR